MNMDCSRGHNWSRTNRVRTLWLRWFINRAGPSCNPGSPRHHCHLLRSPAQCRNLPACALKQNLLYPDTLDDANSKVACHILNAMVSLRGRRHTMTAAHHRPLLRLGLGPCSLHPADCTRRCRVAIPCACTQPPGTDRTKGVFHLRLRSDLNLRLDLFAYTRSPPTQGSGGLPCCLAHGMPMRGPLSAENGVRKGWLQKGRAAVCRRS